VHIDVLFDAKVLGHSPALLAEQEGGMGFVHHEAGVVLPAQRRHFTQRRDVDVH
jgi:hypothetical protein